MNIFKRKCSKYYYVSYYVDGKRIKKCLETTKKSEAISRADAIDKHLFLLKNGLIKPEVKQFTVGDLWIDYEQNVVNKNKKSEGSKDTDRRSINRFIDFVGQHTPINDISEHNVNDFISHLENKLQLAETTIHKCSQIWRSLFSYASKPPYDAKYNPFDWAQSVKQLSKKGEKQLPCPWDLVLDAIEKTDNIKDKMFWTLLAYTGMSNVDGSNVTLDDFKRGYYQRSKTSVRFMIWLHPEIAKYGEAIFGLYKNKNTRDGSARRFKKATGWMLKSVRKTFASTLLTQFESANDAIAFTGHTNIKTLVDHYATVDPEVGKKKLEQMFANA
jgi:integrase